jgi:predicted RNA-binding protein with PUA-like domain
MKPKTPSDRPAWLMKSEPDQFSFDDLRNRPKQTEPWNGVRNYQARNYMRDDMKLGDLVLFYHSNCTEPGVVGLAEVASAPYPDVTQFDAKSEYFDPKATKDNPRWMLIDVKWKTEFKKLVPLPVLKSDPALDGLLATRPGNRLSITPVEPHHTARILALGGL